MFNFLNTAKNERRRPHRNGFILVYTVLILAIMVITAGIFASTVLKEISISRDEAESLKAFYAADAGVECVRYLQGDNGAFNTTSPQGTYNCGIGADFTAGGDPTNRAAGAPACVADTRTFTVSGFSNGSCTIITVNIVPRTVIVGGVPIIVCDAEVISNGRNRCSAGSSKLVERTRWETM